MYQEASKVILRLNPFCFCAFCIEKEALIGWEMLEDEKLMED